jgi:hypothetical protein
MTKLSSGEQIFSILSEAEAGVSARELCRKSSQTPPSTPGVRSLAAWKSLK